MASSSASSCCSSPPGETRALVEEERLPHVAPPCDPSIPHTESRLQQDPEDPSLQSLHRLPDTEDTTSPRRRCDALNLNLLPPVSTVPPPPPLRGDRGEVYTGHQDCGRSEGSKASYGSRGSSRRSYAATSTDGLGPSLDPTSSPSFIPPSTTTFNTKLQDPFGAPRKLALPRASPEHQVRKFRII